MSNILIVLVVCSLSWVSCVDFVLLVVVSILWLSLSWLAGFIVLQVLCLIVCGRFHGLGVSCKQLSTFFWGLEDLVFWR